MTKTAQLQVRVTRAQKALLRKLARNAGEDVSKYILSRVLPDSAAEFRRLVAALSSSEDHRYALAELNELLSHTSGRQLVTTVLSVPGQFWSTSLFLQNYVTAMVEMACQHHDVQPPAWARKVEPLEEPWFATSLSGLRLHLLAASPVAFKRRNLFVDTSLGGRV